MTIHGSLPKDFTDSLARAIQVKLSKSITLVLRTHVQDDFNMLLYIFSAWLFFHFIQWKMVEDIVSAVCIAFSVEWAYSFQEHTPSFMKVIHTCVFFIVMQAISQLAPANLAPKLISNLQYCIVDKFLLVLERIFHAEAIAIWIAVAFLLLITQLFHFDNVHFRSVLQMTLVQITQNIIMQGIPDIFQIPTLVVCMYGLKMATKHYPCTSVIDDYITYTTAVAIQTQLVKWFPDYYVPLFCSLLALGGSTLAKLHKTKEVAKTLVMLMIIDWFMNQLSAVYTSDPFICLFVFLFTLKIISRIFVETD